MIISIIYLTSLASKAFNNSKDIYAWRDIVVIREARRY